MTETGTRMFRFVNEEDQVSMVPRYTPSVPLVEHYRHIGDKGDERALAIFLTKDGRSEPKPKGICADAPQLVQCDPALSDMPRSKSPLSMNVEVSVVCSAMKLVLC